jgi:acetyltransferase-like isoleucine patch superfamily enzyme
MALTRATKFLEKVLYIIWPKYMRSGNEHSPAIVIRYWFLQKVFRIYGSVPWHVHPTSKVSKPENIERGSRTPGFSPSCHIDGRNGIVIGRNVWIGPRVSIISMNHDANNFNNYLTEKPIVIKKNSWLGANCIILPGVHLGCHTVVAVGAVVTKYFPKGDQGLAGVPANIVERLNPYVENTP